MSELVIKQSDASIETFNKGDNKKAFIDVYNYLARQDYDKMILNFENGASMTVEIHEPAIRINLSDIEEGETDFHCGVEESGGHAYNCKDCPNKCEEWYQWDKEFRERWRNNKDD